MLALNSGNQPFPATALPPVRYDTGNGVITLDHDALRHVESRAFRLFRGEPRTRVHGVMVTLASLIAGGQPGQVFLRRNGDFLDLRRENLEPWVPEHRHDVDEHGLPVVEFSVRTTDMPAGFGPAELGEERPRVVVDEQDFAAVRSFDWQLTTNGHTRNGYATLCLNVDGSTEMMSVQRFIATPLSNQLVLCRNHDSRDCRRINLNVADKKYGGKGYPFSYAAVLAQTPREFPDLAPPRYHCAHCGDGASPGEHAPVSGQRIATTAITARSHSGSGVRNVTADGSGWKGRVVFGGARHSRNFLNYEDAAAFVTYCDRHVLRPDLIREALERAAAKLPMQEAAPSPAATPVPSEAPRSRFRRAPAPVLSEGARHA